MTKTYKVYELVKHEMLREIIPDGYSLRTEQGIVMREPDWWCTTFVSEEEDIEAIKAKADDYVKYVILPVFISTP